MYDELKPCPFCGEPSPEPSGLVERGKYVLHWIECVPCAARTAAFETPGEARTAWNARPIESQLEADNARLRGALFRATTGYYARRDAEWAEAVWADEGIAECAETLRRDLSIKADDAV